MNDYTVMMLPSNTTKAEIWKKYVDSCDLSVKPVALSSFKRIWIKYLLHIAVMSIYGGLSQRCHVSLMLNQTSKCLQRFLNRFSPSPCE
jgi:hypothetical protein